MESTGQNISFWLDDDFENITQPREWISVPEKRLLFAILERAVRDILGNEIEEVQAARDWLFEDSMGHEPYVPFSFDWVCRELEINQKEFRTRIFRALAPKHRRMERKYARR